MMTTRLERTKGDSEIEEDECMTASRRGHQIRREHTNRESETVTEPWKARTATARLEKMNNDGEIGEDERTMARGEG